MGINTNAIGGICLTGASYSINGNLITTSLGPVSIVNSSALNLTSGASTSITGAFSQSGGGDVFLSGTLLTVNQPLSFTNVIGLIGDTSLSTGAGAGDITLAAAVNGNKNLTLTAGTGNIIFGGTIGGSTALAALTIQSCTNITYPTTSASSVTQNASSGTTTLSSTIMTTGSTGISLQGTTINQTSLLSTSGTGPIAIVNSGVYTMGGTINASVTFTQSGGGSVNLNGSVASNNANISFANAITLTGSSSLSTGGIGIGNIHISSTVDGANDLSLTAGTGTITLSGAVGGGTRIGALTINSGVANTTGAITAASVAEVAGSTTFGALNTNQAAGINLFGTTFTLGGNVTTTGAGPLATQNTGALVLSGPTFSIAGSVTQIGTGTTTLSSAITAGGAVQFNGPITASGGSLSTAVAGTNINLLSTIDGTSSGVGNLTFDAGNLGTITVVGNIGSTTRMGALVFSNANNITVPNITAASITQSAGAGTTTFGNLNTSAVGGIALTGTAYSINGNLITTNLGPVTITNSGALTLVAGASTSITGLLHKAAAVVFPFQERY